MDVEWGRACDPDQVARALKSQRADIVAMVHGETSTGVVNPVKDIVKIARQHGATTIVDAVTTARRGSGAGRGVGCGRLL